MRKQLNVEEVASRYLDGDAYSRIGLDLDVSPYTIKKCLLERGIRLRTPQEWHEWCLRHGSRSTHRREARAIWTKKRGPIPRGHHIHHKDGNFRNAVLENLECLTHKEHMKLHAIMERQRRMCVSKSTDQEDSHR